MKVTLRERKRKKGTSLYLDIYHKGKRRNMALGLILHTPSAGSKLTKAQKIENENTHQLAENIRAKKLLELQSGLYGFQDPTKLEASFIDYFEYLKNKRRTSVGNYGNWASVFIHLKKFCKEQDVSFSELNSKWVQDFKYYLQQDARTKGNKPLSQNSQHSYFNKVKAALNQAVKEGIIQKNPGTGVQGIKQGDTQREFLTMEELRLLAKTECPSLLLKRTFIFCCLTGLRWSDIQKMTWAEIQHSNEFGHYIRFRQKKTKGTETLPISDEARELLGDADIKESKVFPNLRYSSWVNVKLKEWSLKAGITKNITFHCSRHTYATLLLTKGASIETVSKLLGHRELRTTQIYAKIIDKKKREAADMIKLDLDLSSD